MTEPPPPVGGVGDLSSVRSVESVDVAGKRVLIRVDFNVPIENGVVADATRLERVLPTIRDLVGRGAKVVVLSHLGRPKGVPTPDTSLLPVAAKMRELMPGIAISFVGDCVGDEVDAAVAALKPGEVVVLENVRYHKGEEKNEPAFAKGLASHADIYVGDAFSAAHRAHASIEGIANLLPAYAGLSLMAEIDALRRARDNPARPVMAIVGGAKVSTKIEVLTHLVACMDQLAVGGGMANTFLAASGVDTGSSLVEREFIETAKEIMAEARKTGCEVVLPSDVIVAKEFRPGVESEICPVRAVPADTMILDFGPNSVADLKRRLGEVKTVLWNGPLGAFETAPFGEGTFALAREVARLTRENKLVSVAGGGDTVRALNFVGAADDLTYVSTAGGAFLEWLGGAALPGVVALARSGARTGS